VALEVVGSNPIGHPQTITSQKMLRVLKLSAVGASVFLAYILPKSRQICRSLEVSGGRFVPLRDLQIHSGDTLLTIIIRSLDASRREAQLAHFRDRRDNRLKQWRGLATRFEKRAVNYRAMLVLASIVLWLEP
jgi:transposase